MLPETETVDCEVLCRVDTMSAEELRSYRNIIPTDLKHYMTVQKAWIEADFYYLGCELQCHPTPAQKADRILNGPDSDRFRAYYVLRFPDRVTAVS
jgi:hypothetical protein